MIFIIIINKIITILYNFFIGICSHNYIHQYFHKAEIGAFQWQIQSLLIFIEIGHIYIVSQILSFDIHLWTINA